MIKAHVKDKLCPVCGLSMFSNNKYCCIACYNKANNIDQEGVIED